MSRHLAFSVHRRSRLWLWGSKTFSANLSCGVNTVVGNLSAVYGNVHCSKIHLNSKWGSLSLRLGTANTIGAGSVPGCSCVAQGKPLRSRRQVAAVLVLILNTPVELRRTYSLTDNCLVWVKSNWVSIPLLLKNLPGYMSRTHMQAPNHAQNRGSEAWQVYGKAVCGH